MESAKFQLERGENVTLSYSGERNIHQRGVLADGEVGRQGEEEKTKPELKIKKDRGRK